MQKLRTLAGIYLLLSLICLPEMALADLSVSGDLESGPYTTIGTISSQGVIGAGKAVLFGASGNVVLSSGFHVEDGAVFLASIGDYSQMERTTDSDSNDLQDWWELVYFSSLGQAPDGDYDGDGFTNFIEMLAGTSPMDNSQIPLNTALLSVNIQGPSVVNENSSTQYDLRANYDSNGDNVADAYRLVGADSWTGCSATFAEITSTGLLTTFPGSADQICLISSTYSDSGYFKADSFAVSIGNPPEPGLYYEYDELGRIKSIKRVR